MKFCFHLRFFPCLLRLLLWDISTAQHTVHMPAGPLYRVAGYPFSISCYTSGHVVTGEQIFEFSLYNDKDSLNGINMISTEDPLFPYAFFGSRVRSGDISIQRLSSSSIRLHIKSLQLKDEGHLECHTPNLALTYFGTYNSQTKINVIKDTLVALSSNPSSMSVSEGGALHLACQVSSQTFQHTHLSVSWLLLADGDTEPRPIITLDRDLTVRPGKTFERRYASGLVSITKLEDTMYKLQVDRVQKDVQGKIYCRASEWIQDPDRSWVSIAYKDAETSNVEVKAVEVAANSFIPYIEAVKSDLQEGEALELNCRVETRNSSNLFFTVAWIKEDRDMAQMGPLGVVTFGQDYERRAKEGELSLVKTNEKEYLLLLRPVRAEDKGRYFCTVWQEERSMSSLFTKGQSQVSSPVDIGISTKASGLKVTMASEVVVNEASPLRIYCNVTGAIGQLSVMWQHKKTSQGSSFSDVIGLSTQGVMSPGPLYRQRGTRTFRSELDVFVLEMNEALLSDVGTYKCTVSENNRMKTTSIQSQECSVRVLAIDDLLKVSLKSRTANVKVGEEVRLLCVVKGPRVPLSVTWKFQRQGSSGQQTVTSMLHSGELEWGKRSQSYQVSTTVADGEAQYILSVGRASLQESGSYQCLVEAYLQQTQRANKPSNLLGVQVTNTESRLSVTSSSPSPIKSSINSDVLMDCSIGQATSNSSSFGIAWTVGGRTIASRDRSGVVNLLEVGKRLSMRMREGPSFELTIRNTGASDSGHYQCQVEEWLQDPHGDWYPLPSKSVTMELIVSEKPTDFKLNKTDIDLNVMEGDQLSLTCLMSSGAQNPSFDFSMTWFFSQRDSLSEVPLLSYEHTGILKYHVSSQELQSRLQFTRPSDDVFHLTIPNAGPADSGRYFCEVEQYQLSCDGEWEKKGTEKSGASIVTVNPIASRLRLLKNNQTFNVSDLDRGFPLLCHILTRSSDKSVFEVTWTRTIVENEEKSVQVIYNASRDGTLQPLDGSRDGLLFKRPKTLLYLLTVTNVGPSDNGVYACQVVEWLQISTKTWRKLSEDKSGDLTIHVQTEGKLNFRVHKDSTRTTLTEGDDLIVNCSLGTETPDPASLFSITWFFQSQNSSGFVQLLSYKYNGFLSFSEKYPALWEKVRFFMSSPTNFSLAILRSSISDSGRYLCRVDMYTHDCKGDWRQVATDKSGVTQVTVVPKDRYRLLPIGAQLDVKKENSEVNVPYEQSSFKVDCNIKSRSHINSSFEVIWSKKGIQNAIYTARRDGTLQGGESLMLGHPEILQYTLTVPTVDPYGTGKYSCHVVEWLLTSLNDWRKLAEAESGELVVNVLRPDKPVPTFLPWLLIVIALIFVVVVLSVKVHKSRSGSAQKKNNDSLWAENNPLRPIKEA
ncbi:immunoglobulin superfamily member 3 [Denticeps clupeoides]|uniref:Ig-like domain-containing protein n=1 Tax=Denticeps clupeoides TaxID=299321 RepID=A0AAY4C5W3_9TELE|nr:immunoglobulin superfamily member 3-like [Denticeps clupeoides]XP_028847118.1 immunoglobulin superfamily member 3-like [Denticeps clupeoides]